jgi:hypothetical protein
MTEALAPFEEEIPHFLRGLKPKMGHEQSALTE